MTRRRARPVMDRFMEKVAVVATGCWEWQGYIKPNGYGDFRYEGGRWAHRASHELFRGPIPDGMELDHLCRNKRCVNPTHLEPVTGTINQQRAKPWTVCGEYHPGVPSRFAARGRGTLYCRECGRVREAARRSRLAAQAAGAGLAHGGPCNPRSRRVSAGQRGAVRQ